MSVSRFLPQSLKSTTAAVSAVAILGVGVYTYSYTRSTAHAESTEPSVMFSGFRPTTLRLQSVKIVNHNTKRLVFEFPDKNARSGLPLTCRYLPYSFKPSCMYWLTGMPVFSGASHHLTPPGQMASRPTTIYSY